jgi:hypothetical protein
MITEVEVTEGGVASMYSPYVPANTETSPWLENVLKLLLFAPHNQRRVTLPGTHYEVDRANVTSITITRSHSG